MTPIKELLKRRYPLLMKEVEMSKKKLEAKKKRGRLGGRQLTLGI